ncbi:sensor histidine kinase [Nitratifractor salsuginis]|uniref:histidine kinase n=1 Tax=Nitratifractor salsuginis (strain DSM 16511 / JCM 12458 / E9I37-1) TaxID=749222 RepID=E6WZA0_NITSE|nr:sensor histidine kinase [Nitratifractor salsuginis]ADV46612.1 integral membrane sensor signal transduction histidine kinase [Nitratifractor salsuginis DSM 16511]
MPEPRPISRRKFTTVLALSFFIYGILLMLSFYLFSHWLIDKKEREKFRSEVTLEAANKERFLNLYLTHLSRSLRSIAYNPYFMSYVVDPKYLNSAEFLFLTIMLEHDDYMQLRFLGADGKERLRFDRDSPEGYPYKVGKLQDKSKRYYFYETARLKEGEIHTSKIDYNIENGKVVHPIVPVFRVSTPIYFEGKFKGVLTINTFAQKIIELFTSSPIFDTIIFDKDGYVIYAEGKFYDRKYQPKKLTEILPLPPGKLPRKLSDEYLSEKHRFYVKAMPMGTRTLYVAYRLKPGTALTLKKEDYQAAGIMLLLLILLALPLSWLLARPTEHMFEIVARQRQELEEFSHTLEDRVREKTEENARKDRLIIHQARLAELGEMIGNIAHQWRHPLTRLSLILQNLKALNKKDRLDKEQLEKMLSIANEQIFFMSDTIENFRNFYRPATEAENFSVKEAYTKVMEIVGYDLKHKNISIEYLENERVELHGMMTQFAQVFLNLIVNARDALMEREIPDPRIRIEVRCEKDELKIELSDNAGGIPEEHLEKIFEPYFSTKREKGTGVGLYMVKTIIEEKYGGSVKVENTREGARFTLTIPLPQKGRGASDE